MLKILTIVQILIDKGEKFTLELNDSGELKLGLDGSYIVKSNAVALGGSWKAETLSLERFNQIEFETGNEETMYEVMQYKVAKYHSEKKEG